MREEGTTRPSPRAVERFARDLGGEVADLRSSLRHALDEAGRHQADGRPDRAAAVLTEQQEVLAAVHRRLEERLAAAAVEREAEGVLAEAAPSSPWPTTVAPGAAVAGPPSGDDGESLALRLLASAAAASVAVALLVAPEAEGSLTAAGSVVAGDALHERAAPRPPEDSDVAAVRSPQDDAAQPTSVPLRLGDLTIPEAAVVRSDTASDEAGAPDEDPLTLTLSLPSQPASVGVVVGEVDEAPVAELTTSAGDDAEEGETTERWTEERSTDEESGASTSDDGGSTSSTSDDDSSSTDDGPTTSTGLDSGAAGTDPTGDTSSDDDAEQAEGSPTSSDTVHVLDAGDETAASAR